LGLNRKLCNGKILKNEKGGIDMTTRKSRNGVTPEAVIQNLISSLDNSAS